MDSLNNHIKIHSQCKVVPHSSTQLLSFPLTFFDLMWLRFHPVERIFFYTLPISQSHPTFFFQNLVPKLKTSLSLTLQHFLPLAGKIHLPSDSSKPFIQFNPNNDDGVSFLIVESDLDFNHVIQNSPQDASFSRSFIPHLESTDSFASIVSIQITLFPKNGFSIGISTHHAVLDGKSSTMFIKAWSFICKSLEQTQSPSLELSLEPFLEKEVIKDPNDFGNLFINNWNRFSSHLDKGNVKSIKILSNTFQPNVKDSVRATFKLAPEDLEKINKRVLSKWNNFEEKAQEQEQETEQEQPKTLSTFVLTCAYVSVCIAKAIQQSESEKEHKFVFGFAVDCRARLDPPIPKNYFGNCVCNHIVDSEPQDFTKENGVVIVAKNICGKIKQLDKGILDGVETVMFRFLAMVGEGVKGIGVAGSTKFGEYEIDFGFGRPEKVEIISIDRGLTIGLIQSKDLENGVEFGLVLDKNVMGLFHTIFHEGLSFD